VTTAIWWIRRDLRLADNQALTAALAHSVRVLPLFILDERLLNSPYVGEKRSAFLFAGLAALDRSLRGLGSHLVVRAGDPARELARLIAETGASAIFAERDHSPFAIRRDEAIGRSLPLHLTEGITAARLAGVFKDDGDPYTVFTPFSRKWKSSGELRERDLLAAPTKIHSPQGVASGVLPSQPSLPANILYVAGEVEAQRRLHAFVSGGDAPIYRYADLRNRPDLDATAQLSPYLRFGMLSARQAAVAAYSAMRNAPSPAAAKSAEVWLNELIWREFYVSILAHFPHVRTGAFRPQYDALAWSNDELAFAAWCEGRTGYPFIDAAMRQLSVSGWMHNRARMAVASFLVKDLLIDWRWGERWFMQHLLDGDPASNNGGWQWTAGVGTDAAPYFRIFNPVSQGQKFDPDGVFVRRWLPELAHVPARFIHEPWLMERSEQERAGCVIGVDYPPPIIDHGWARERVLAAFQAVK
jgi:deoxyribodipyrimidine photo-lyase